MDITALNVQYEDVQETSRAAGPHAPEVTVTESSPMTAEPRVLAGRDSPDGAPVVQSNEPVEVFGYLQKQGRRLKAWHQRWFEIRGQHMYYFKNNTKKQCLGEIQLSICTQARPTDVATFGHSFEIVTSERTHILAARTTEDMEKWIDKIKKNMGPRSGSSPTKVNKVKKWDSFKTTFRIHRSVSPQPSNPTPAPSQDSHVPVSDPVRNKSFLDKFRRIKRDRSNSAERRTAELRDQEKTIRPLSEDGSYSQNQQQLVAALVDPPVAVSVPNSPLSRKRQKTSPVSIRKHKSFSPGSRTPGDSSGGATPRSTPERSTPEPSSPRHASTPMTTTTEDVPPSPPRITFATPRPLVNDSTKLSPRRNIKKQPTPPSPLASDETPIPDIFTKPLVWDDVKLLLDSTQDTEPLFLEESLSPRDEPWAEKESPVDQLREFLAVCP